MSSCRCRVRRRQLPARAALVVVCCLLGACATIGSGGGGGSSGSVGVGGSGRASRVDWPAYGVAIASEPPAARDALIAEARSAHLAEPTAENAIRLAVLSASFAPDEDSLDTALALLDEAESSLVAGAPARPAARDEESLAFVRFYRPLVGALRDGRAALAAEVSARQALARQIEELRELEERLNADDAER